MKRLALTATLALPMALSTAIPASALSCMRPSVETSFAIAQEAPEEYVMAVGVATLDPDQQVPPSVSVGGGPKDVTVTATFSGRLATVTGFDREVDAPITVDISCGGPWCGTAPSAPSLMFLQRTAHGYLLPQGPCPQFSLPLTLQDDMEGRAMACLTGTAACDSLVPAR